MRPFRQVLLTDNRHAREDFKRGKFPVTYFKEINAEGNVGVELWFFNKF